jgi:hypothetical protein
METLSFETLFCPERLSAPYGHCVDCDKRSQYVCIALNYCYSCHHKIEAEEKENEVTRRPIALNALTHPKTSKDVQSGYRVNFVTYKIAS